MTGSMRLRALAPAALAALALTACWPVPGGNADRTAHNPFETAFTPARVGALEPAWTAELGPGATGQIVLDHSSAFVRVDRTVRALDVRSGATRWTWNVPPDFPEFSNVSDPSVVGSRVLVGYGYGGGGGFWGGSALDPLSGQPAGGGVASGVLATARGPIVASATASFGSGTPIAVGYRLADVSGATTVNGGTLSIEAAGNAAQPDLTIGDQGVYHSGNGLVGDPATPVLGLAVRRFPLPARGQLRPVGRAVLRLPRLGDRRWPRSHRSSSARGSTRCTSASPEARWPPSTPSPVPFAGRRPSARTATDAPALAGGVLYVPTADGDLVAVSADGCGAATCAPLWSAAVDGTALAGQPAVSGDGADAVVFAATAGGSLAALAAGGCGAATCPVLGHVDVGAAVTGSPAVSNGKVVVGTADGTVAAFRVPAD